MSRKNNPSDLTKQYEVSQPRHLFHLERYSDFEELTPEILRAFIDNVLIYEKQKVDGHIRHTIEIIYNFVGAVEIPDFD